VGTVVDTTEEIWDRVINVNLKSVFLFSNYAIPAMAEREGGTIVNIASVNGFVALANEAAYDAAKGGVVILSKAIAIDHHRQKIRVNRGCPSATDTPMLNRSINVALDPEKQRKSFIEYNAALHLLIKQEEIAYAVFFLASDESSAVTRAAPMVDGGWTAI